MNATNPFAVCAHNAQFPEPWSAKLSLLRVDLLTLTPDEVLANYFASTAGRNGFGMAEAAGLIVEAELTDECRWRFTAARVADVAEFAINFGAPVTHERALQLCLHGCLNSEQYAELVEGLELWAVRHGGAL